MMRHILKAAAAVMVACCMASCGEKKFHVEGSVADAKDSLLYFENMSLQGPVVVDSVKLSADGEFSFSADASTAPEFYRLRIGDQIINLAADSTETVSVKAHYATMATGYEVSGSADCERIKQLSLMQIGLQNQVMDIQRNQALGADAIADSVMRVVEAYKRQVKDRYIFSDPKAASAYFALFQTLGDYLIFNPRSNRDDIRVFAAVATSWDTFYPGSVRGENLHNIALTGMKTERIVDAERQEAAGSRAKVTTSGLIDIQLADNKGTQRSLTQLKGKVVMLDFHVFATKESPRRILMLRELYSKYHDRGFEIYQVALDADEHFWKQQTAALPWISVRDEEGPDAPCLRSYNVSSVPEYFLIDRDNNLVGRSSQIKDLDAEIQKLL